MHEGVDPVSCLSRLSWFPWEQEKPIAVEADMQAFFFIAVAAVILVVVICGQIQAAKRKKELCLWAARLGMSFSETRDSSFDDRYPFSCLTKGDDRYAQNICRGRLHDRDATTFDYHYETHSTDGKGHRTTYHHWFSAVMFSTQWSLKPLSIRTENLFDKIGAFFGLEDINFESAEFSREFCVASPDRRWAFDVLHQETMEFLLASPRFTLEMGGPHVIAYRENTFSVADFEAAANLLAGLLDRIPKTVLEEAKGTN
ncbi:MAG: hypothetical protein ABFC77_10195 [Thermoguttaceae bacterium]